MRRSRWKRPSAPVNTISEAPRKPRIMVAGEFSAGKTKLVNGLAGEEILPSNVTATALPPVWMVGGAEGLARVDSAGALHAVGNLSELDFDTTRFCVMGHSAPILKQLDIIDTPGNSDPNMDSETWKRMLDYADAVVWCTNATQAWRQSEKAVWQAMPERLRKNAMLIVTHADLMTDQANAGRVMQRVEREAADYFETFLMVSLLDPGDVDGIRELVQDLGTRMETAGGADAAMIDEFLTGKHVTGGATETPRRNRVLESIRPRRVKPSAPESTSKEQEHDGVVPISIIAAATYADRKGRARTLWNELLADVDRDDPTAILAAVDRMLSILDSEPKSTSAGVDRYSGTSVGNLATVSDQE